MSHVLDPIDNSPSFESLRDIMAVEHLSEAWSWDMMQQLRAHLDAGVELHPLHERHNQLCDQGLPLHNLFVRAMSDNLGASWPMVLEGVARGSALDGHDHEQLVNVWRSFWVDQDTLDATTLVNAGGKDAQWALDMLQASIAKLEDLGMPHPREAAPQDWNDVMMLTHVGRLYHVEREREALQKTLDAEAPLDPHTPLEPSASTPARSRPRL